MHEWKHIAGYVARTHTQSQRTSKPGLRPRTRACSEKDVLSRERFPLNILSFSSLVILLSACQLDEMTPTLIRLCSVQLLHLSHAHSLKIAYLAQGHRHWFSPKGRRSQTYRSLRSHVYVFAQFLIASVRGCGLWGESGTDNNHFVFACISHSKNNQQW